MLFRFKNNILFLEIWIYYKKQFFIVLQQPNKADAGDYKVSVKNKWGTDFTTWLLGWKKIVIYNYTF